MTTTRRKSEPESSFGLTVQRAAAEAAQNALDQVFPVIQQHLADSAAQAYDFSRQAITAQFSGETPSPAPTPSAPPVSDDVLPEPAPAPAPAPEPNPAPTPVEVTPVANQDTSLPWSDDPAPSAAVEPVVPIAPPSPVVVPVSGVLKTEHLKDLANWRAFLHQLAPVVVGVLMTLQVATSQNTIMVYVALFFAVADPLLSFTNSTDTVRRVAYSLLGVLQTAGTVSLLFAGHSTAIPVITAAVAITSAFVARFFTPTTTVVSQQVAANGSSG
jgi:hypothetical protein